MKKSEPKEMAVPRHRQYPHDVLGESTSIPRDTEFDLHPAPSRTHTGFDECAFESPKPGNAKWKESDRP